MEPDWYSDFIFISEEARENFSNLSDAHLNAICSVLHEAIVESQYKIREEMNGQE